MKTFTRNKTVGKSTASLPGTGTVTTVTSSDGSITITDASTTPNLSVNCCVRSVKKSLSAADIQSGFTVPISAIVPSGGTKIIAILGAQCVFTAGGTPFTSSSIILSTINGDFGSFDGVSLSGSSKSSILLPQNNSLTTLAGKTIYITTNADSAVGDGTAIVYIQYMEITA